MVFLPKRKFHLVLNKKYSNMRYFAGVFYLSSFNNLTYFTKISDEDYHFSYDPIIQGKPSWTGFFSGRPQSFFWRP